MWEHSAIKLSVIYILIVVVTLCLGREGGGGVLATYCLY